MTIEYRRDSGGAPIRKNAASDCVPRAIAILTGMEYSEAYRMVGDCQIEVQRKSRTFKGKPSRSLRSGTAKKATALAMERAGLVKVSLGRGARPTYSEAHARFGDCIVSTTKHVAAIVGGALRDTFDGRFYEWQDADGFIETRERKAMSVWVPAK